MKAWHQLCDLSKFHWCRKSVMPQMWNKTQWKRHICCHLSFFYLLIKKANFCTLISNQNISLSAVYTYNKPIKKSKHSPQWFWCRKGYKQKWRLQYYEVWVLITAILSPFNCGARRKSMFNTFFIHPLNNSQNNIQHFTRSPNIRFMPE